MTAILSPALPAAYLMHERTEGGCVYRDYVNDWGQLVAVKAGGPDGERPAAETLAEARQVFARFNLGKAGASRPCPDHPGRALQPLPGGGARGTCPVDSRSYQMSPPEVTA